MDKRVFELQGKINEMVDVKFGDSSNKFLQANKDMSNQLNNRLDTELQRFQNLLDNRLSEQASTVARASESALEEKARDLTRFT